MKLLATIIALFIFSRVIAQAKRDTIAANMYGKKGNTLYGEGKFDSAIYYYKKAATADQDKGILSGFSYAYIGQLYNQTGHTAEALKYVNKAIDLHTDKMSVSYAQNVLISIYKEQKEYKKMTTLCYTLMQKDSTNADPYLNMGTWYQETAAYDSSQYYLNRAIKLDNDQTWKSATAYISLAKVYMSTNEKGKAVGALNKAIVLKKSDASVKYAQKMLDDINKKK